MDIKSLLRSIDSAEINNLNDVFSVISKLNVIAEEADTVTADPATKAAIDQIHASIGATLQYAQDMLDKLSDFKSYVESLQHANLGEIISNVELSIYSFNSVVDAQQVFTIDWFADTLLPDDDKQHIAQVLIDNCSKYTKSYQDLYQAIVDGVPDIMEKIRYPKPRTT